ncbi:MAG TPA: recombinase family protein [Oculatellaceae cyanobacterium]
MVQTAITAKTAVIYCRVSTEDQSCERQERDLKVFAERAGYDVKAIYKETASGAKNDRKQRAEVMKLAQARQIDAVLVTELSRWGRSTTDLLETLNRLASFNVSVIAQTGMTFDLSSAQGKLMLGIMASLAEFERDLLRERVKSGLNAAKAKGVKLGRQEGQNPSDKYTARVIDLINAGRSYRWIAHELQISKTTVTAIAKRRAG